MALGPHHFNVTVSLDRLFCFQGDDVHDLFGGDSELYMWVVMFKIDGEGLRQGEGSDINRLVGEPVYFFSRGSHGNITDGVSTGQTITIPNGIGTWTTSLRTIPVAYEGTQLTAIPGIIGACAVLIEENSTPSDAVEAGHQSLNNLVRTTVNQTIASLGLAGIAADAAAEVAAAAQQGRTVSIDAAAQLVVRRRLEPIINLFTIASSSSTAIEILENLGLAGFISTAVNPDNPAGAWIQTFSQRELVNSGDITINHKWWTPDQAYTLHGKAGVHRRYVAPAPPASRRLEVTCTQKRQGPRISGIGGVDNGTPWTMGRGTAAEAILMGQREFFTRNAAGAETRVEAVQGGYYQGRPWYYLQTTSDMDDTNNLINLPDCMYGDLGQTVYF